ncbi:MAG: VWA domain-containing protein, partial [bacterium]
FYLYHIFAVDCTKEYVIYTEINGTYYVLKMDGTTETRASLSELDKLSSDYKWKVNYLYADNGEYYYNIVPVNNTTVSLALNDEWYANPLVQNGRNNVMISEYEDGVRIHFQPWGKGDIHLKNAGENFFSQSLNNNETSQIKMHLYEQRSLDSYELTVETEDVNWGHVSGYNNNNQWQDSVERFTTYASPTTANGPKTNAYEIRAVDGGLLGSNGQYKYIFDYWTLNGARVGAGKTIGKHTLEIPESGLTLTAHYKRNPSYVAKDEDKHGKFIDKASLTAWLKEMMENQLPLDPKGCSKTAEVYDYENRIYRVDLTSKSSLSTFDGMIDLGFIIDVSASMKFPSKINYINKDYALCYINDYGNRNWLTQGQTYYIIADETGTATVCEIKYRNGNWQWKDASKADSEFKTITSNKTDAINAHQFHASDATDANWNKTYKIYQIDPNDHHDRKYYLENSISNTITTLQDILNVLKIAANSNNDPDVGIAWNTFMNYLPNETSNGAKSRQRTFTSALNGINLRYAYDGGTSTDIALLDAAGYKRNDVSNRFSKDDVKNWKKTTSDYNSSKPTYTRVDVNSTNADAYGFDWDNGATKKYAVLITDGAPQRSSQAVDSRYVKEAANLLKNERGVKLITVGLSMGNVDVGRRLLYDIASTDAENDPYFYEANSGDELEYVLYSIIETIMQDCSVFGDVTDTVGEAFYPVDLATGAPLKDGDWIDINGNKVSSNASNRAGKIIATTSNGKTTYQVKWTNQEFSFDGWHGTVYVKAKEDFLGGDIVKTNKGEALIEAKQYQIPGKAKADLKTGRQNVVVTVDGETITNVYDTSITMKSPRVNVNELNFTENSTEWTVYVGTEVEPLPQIKALYEQIKIEEVVTANDSSKPEQAKDANSLRFPVMASEADDRTPSGTPVTFYLKDLITKLQSEAGQPTLDWNELIRLSGLEGDANTGITFRYDIYTPNYQESIDANDRDYPSTINIKLVKDHDPAKHATNTVGDAVETYTLKMKFAPDYQHVPVGQNGDGSVEYHTGTWGIGSPGTAAGTETSTNNHIINVIKRIIELKKTNMDGDLLKEAKFKIYRKDAQEQEIDIATVTTENGVYSWDGVEPAEDQKLPGNYWKDETVYYIRETEAPTDHQKYDGEITVTLNMSDVQTYMVAGNTASPYNWTQTPTLEITG